MLFMELSGQSYNKSAHRKQLLGKLNDRSEGAIERKHQNISAILLENGWPYINGYKPLGNYQGMLREIVETQLRNDRLLDEAAIQATLSPATTPLLEDYAKTLTHPPEQRWVAREPTTAYRLPQQRDYLEREARNVSLGQAGEAFVVNFEHLRLRAHGQPTSWPTRSSMFPGARAMVSVSMYFHSTPMAASVSSRLRPPHLARKHPFSSARTKSVLPGKTQRSFISTGCSISAAIRGCSTCPA